MIGILDGRTVMGAHSVEPNLMLYGGGLDHVRTRLKPSDHLREVVVEAGPAIETHLLVDTVPLNRGFVARDLLRRACPVLDLERNPILFPLHRNGLVAEWTRAHSTER